MITAISIIATLVVIGIWITIANILYKWGNGDDVIDYAGYLAISVFGTSLIVLIIGTLYCGISSVVTEIWK